MTLRASKRFQSQSSRVKVSHHKNLGLLSASDKPSLPENDSLQRISVISENRLTPDILNAIAAVEIILTQEKSLSIPQIAVWLLKDPSDTAPQPPAVHRV